MIFFWECFAQNLETQGQIVYESIEGLAFADRGFCDVFEIVAQMLSPYNFAVSNLLGQE
jgi:hypothetical protein